MESILKKFESNAIDMSKFYGGFEQVFTGEMLYATSGGEILKGKEYVDIYDDGCFYSYFISYTGTGVYSVDYIC
jgi:hypothetical protein